VQEEWRRAAISGDAGTIGRLLAEGADIDALDRYGQTALMLAAMHGRGDVVRVLLKSGAATDVTAKYGLSALMLATVNRHEAIARELVDGGAETSLQGSGAPGFAGKTARELALDAGLDELAGHIAASGSAGTP